MKLDEGFLATLLEGGEIPRIECVASEPDTGYYVLAEPPPGKYDPAYAARYAGLWAYGYETLRQGANESLYRTVGHLSAQALAATQKESQVILDLGCGIGRCACDVAELTREGLVLAVDSSTAMLEVACQVANKRAVCLDLTQFGFGLIDLPKRGPYRNLAFFRGDVLALPFREGIADVLLCANVMDRVASPHRLLTECFRLLRPGGQLVFTSPLNWDKPELWERYPTAESVRRMAEEDVRFRFIESFDELFYKELLDARLSYQAFNTFIFRAAKPG